MIRLSKKNTFFFLLCVGLLSVGIQCFSKVPDSIAVKNVNQTLLQQIQKLSAYRKNSNMVQYVEMGASSSALMQTRCTRFWNLLNNHKQIQIPIPVFAKTGILGEMGAADSMYNAALSNKKNTEIEGGVSNKQFQNFLRFRHSDKFALQITASYSNEKSFQKEKFYANLISQFVNPFVPRLDAGVLIESPKYDPIYLIYKNHISLESQQELTLVTLVTRLNHQISFVHNGMAFNGMLNHFVDIFDYGYYFGIDDGTGYFDKATYSELKPLDVFHSSDTPFPGLLNGLIQMDGLVLRWSLKYSTDNNYKILQDQASKIKAKYILTLGETVTDDACSIFFR